MSLKSELLTYQAALAAYDERQYSLALDHFGKIAETSKVQWNMGMILASMGRHNEAIARFSESVEMDQYLVVGWYQRGVSYFMVGLYDKAVKDFDQAWTYMRGNNTINYTQLGLAHTLYSAEILYNLGLTKFYLRQTSAGLQDLRRAQTEKALPEHAVIDDCIRDQGRGYTAFSVPEGLLFRPSDSKLRNLTARDYMGKAVLVAASDPNEAYTTFTGITRLQRGQTPTGAPLDPSHPLSRSATLSKATSKPVSDNNVDLPIASRMAKRSQTVRIGPKPMSPIPSPGLSRSLTVSNPDPPSPARHARSRTADSTSIYTTSDLHPAPTPLMRPVRPRIVIPTTDISPDLAASIQSDRYSAFPVPANRNRLQPPAAYPTSTTSQRLEVLQTPQEGFSPLDEIYDDYRSPTPELEADTPEMPYTAIGRSFTSPSPVSIAKSPSPSLPPSSYRAPTLGTLARAESTRSNTTLARSTSAHRGPGQGLMLTVEDADGISPTSSLQELIKIRIKVHHGDHTRGMSIHPSDTYDHLVRALRAKFPNLGSRVGVRFRDEDGDMLSMQDDGDFEAAVDVARVLSRGRAEGKLEIWID